MSDLAFNMNGEPFELPPTMAAWRVRKLKPKGAPEVVYGRDGLPLFLPMDAEIEDLRREARADGRYRLDPVDDHNRTVPNAQSSYVCVHPIEREPEPTRPAPAPPSQTDTTALLVAALLESQKQHTELARMYVSQFPVVSNAMAGVVRSAGDVGLTTRVPLVVPVASEVKPAEPSGESHGDDDESDDDDEISDETDGESLAVQVEPQPEYSWARVAQTFADHVSPHVGPLLEGLPGLAAMLGAKRAATASDAARGPDRSDPSDLAPTEAESRAPSGPALGFDAGLLIRINAIKARLTPDEREFAQMLMDEIAPEELPVWMGRLRSMSLDEAAAYVREKYRQGQAAADRTRPVAPSAPSTTPRSARPRAAVRPTVPSVPGDAHRDRRQPMPSPISEAATPAAGSSSTRAPRRPTPSNGLALLDEGTQAHLAAIDQALTLDEAAALRKQFAALPPRERASWVATLVLLPVADAVAAIRAQLTAADAPAVPASPALAPSGPEMPDTPAASGAIASAPSARASLDGAGAVRASNAALVTPVSPHDQPAPSALATAPLPASATARNEPSSHVAIDRNADLHLAEIERALTPDERVRMHAMFSRLSPDERDVWLDQLLSAPPSHGTALLRDALGENPAQPRPPMPPVRSSPIAIAAPSNDAPGAPIQAPERASAPHEPAVEITELDDTAEPDDTAELADAELERTGDLDEVAAIIDLGATAEADETAGADATTELDETPDRVNEPTRAADPARDAHTADDPTSPDDADPARADRDVRPTKQRAAASNAPGPATAEADPGHHLAAIEAALTLAEKMRAHELAAQRPAAELRRWYAELLRLSVPDAVAKIRAELARSDANSRATKKGGAS